jgi:predicted nucleic acid-binding protein
VEALRDFNHRLGTGRIATCGMVKLELLWTVQDSGGFALRREQLEGLEDIPIGPPAWNRAIEVLQTLAGRGPLHHRQVKLPDLLIAATAELAGIAVCHYDRDFEVIAGVTGQSVRAIAPVGSL